jgi:hypothetical protein
MTFELKTLSPDAVPRALAKAERYRLLNEPGEAASICLDAIEIDPDNQEALTTLVLALTEQFGEDLGPSLSEVLKAAGRLERLRQARHAGSASGAGRGGAVRAAAPGVKPSGA